MKYPVIRLAIGHALHLLVVSTCKQYISLTGRFSVWYLGIFLRVMPYFGKPEGRVKTQETSTAH